MAPVFLKNRAPQKNFLLSLPSSRNVLSFSTATLTVPTPSASVLSSNSTICEGGSANLQIAITGGVSPYIAQIDNYGTITGYISGTNIPVSPTELFEGYSRLRRLFLAGCQHYAPVRGGK